jgi:phage-related protein (TIGR01555 family)
MVINMPSLRTRLASILSRKPARTDAAAIAAPRADGYVETIGEIAGQPAYLYQADMRLDASMLAQVYEGDALAARIVDALPRDAMRSTWDLVQLDREYDWRSVQSHLDELKATQAITRAWTWARLYGGALIVMAIEDGRPPEMPVDLTKVKSILGLEVIESSRVSPANLSDLRTRPERPEHYEIRTTNGATRKIHSSRVLRFDSYRVPPERLRQNSGWPPSVLQRCWSSLCRYRAGQRDIAAMSSRMSVLVLMAKDWRRTAMATAAQKDGIRTYLRQLWAGMNAFNLLALDKDDEEIVEIKRSLEGVEALQSTAVDALVSDSGCPRLLITGEQTSTGLNSDSKGERRMWYDYCIAERKVVAEPALDELLALEFQARRNRNEVVPSDWVIEWSPLEQEAMEDKASRATAWSGFAASMVTAGVLTPEQAQAVLVSEGIVEQSVLDDAAPVEVGAARVRPPAPDQVAANSPTQ